MNWTTAGLTFAAAVVALAAGVGLMYAAERWMQSISVRAHNLSLLGFAVTLTAVPAVVAGLVGAS